MRNVIFYFSGTGNSLQVANDIARKIGECDVFNLAKYRVDTEIEAERVGIVFPVYFWGIPNIVGKFLDQIKFSGNPYIFAVATCGHVEGASLIQVKDLLHKKSQKLSSGFMIKMPENYILLFNTDSEKTQKKRFADEKRKTAAIGSAVAEKKVLSLEKSKYGIDTLFGKIVNHYAVGNFSAKDAGFNVNGKCTGCGKCLKVCSVGNIELKNNRPLWNHHCEFCLGCLQWCPVQAINYKNKTQTKIRYTNPNG